MNGVKLSKDFYLEEFLTSQTAARMGMAIEPSPAVLDNLHRLCHQVLQPIRTLLNRPMVVSSGYRPPWLNAAIGGSSTSAHMRGEAADLKVIGMTPVEFALWVQAKAPEMGLPIDQCILEFNRWVHIGTAMKPRHEYLTAKAVDGRTVYERGINP